jgi:nitrite reductase (NO-forming)
MYGLILVEPKLGLPEVDKEFFIVQGEFYTEGKFGEKGPQHFSMEKALREQPEYVVFNGRVGALMGDKALKVDVGESARIYLGNAGPSLVSSFHVVGEIFDSVYSEGGILPNQHNVQTTIVPVGGSAMVEFAVEVPGDYQLVDHSMFRAFNKGAMGALKAEGKENLLVFSGKTAEEIYRPATRLEQLVKTADGTSGPLTDVELLEKGAHVYSTLCVTCHQADGQGTPGVFPPVASSDYLMADKERSIRILLEGLKDEITVNGAVYRGTMPKFPLTDAQIASALTFVRNSFGNKGDPVRVEEVQRVREAGAMKLSVQAAKASPVRKRRKARK